MSEPRATATASHRLVSGTSRLVRAWRVLPHERRLAAYAALGLFLALFLPWYQESAIVRGLTGTLQTQTESLTGWGAFSFVEAAVLLVAVGVLTLLFHRAESRAFHVPGGDGWVITAAGLWTCLLIIWRIFDKQGTAGHGQFATTAGIEWGIFVALGIAAFLAYAGSRIRAAHRPEPPLPGEDDLSAPARPAPQAERPARPPRPVRAEEPPTVPADEPPTVSGGDPPTRRADDPPTRRADDPPPRRADDPPPRRADDPPPRRADDPPPRRADDPPPRRADEPPTRRMGSPSTQAGKARSGQPDEQLTIPLDEL